MKINNKISNPEKTIYSSINDLEKKASQNSLEKNKFNELLLLTIFESPFDDIFFLLNTTYIKNLGQKEQIQIHNKTLESLDCLTNLLKESNIKQQEYKFEKIEQILEQNRSDFHLIKEDYRENIIKVVDYLYGFPERQVKDNFFDDGKELIKKKLASTLESRGYNPKTNLSDLNNNDLKKIAVLEYDAIKRAIQDIDKRTYLSYK